MGCIRQHSPDRRPQQKPCLWSAVQQSSCNGWGYAQPNRRQAALFVAGRLALPPGQTEMPKTIPRLLQHIHFAVQFLKCGRRIPSQIHWLKSMQHSRPVMLRAPCRQMGYPVLFWFRRMPAVLSYVPLRFVSAVAACCCNNVHTTLHSKTSSPSWCKALMHPFIAGFLIFTFFRFAISAFLLVVPSNQQWCLLAAGRQKQWLHSRVATAASWPTQQANAVHAVQGLEPDVSGGC